MRSLLLGFAFAILLILGAHASAPVHSPTGGGAIAAEGGHRLRFPLVAVSHATATPTLTPTPTPVQPIIGTSASALFERVNSYRAAAGLPLADYSPTLSDGAQKHAHYMIVNWGQFGHSEDPNLPGYTPEGDRAARSSDLAWGFVGPAEAVDGWIAGIYHRLWITNPKLKAVGVGWAQDGARTAAVLNVIDSWTERPDFPYPVAYPPEGMAGVPVRFDGNETPDPIATCAGFGYPVGYVVSLHFEIFQPAPTITTAELRDAAGQLVSICLKAPTEARMYNTLALIPAAPLRLGAAYRVDVAGTYRGQPFRRTWQFTTGTTSSSVQAVNSGRPPSLGMAPTWSNE